MEKRQVPVAKRPAQEEMKPAPVEKKAALEQRKPAPVEKRPAVEEKKSSTVQNKPATVDNKTASEVNSLAEKKPTPAEPEGQYELKPLTSRAMDLELQNIMIKVRNPIYKSGKVTLTARDRH